MDLDELFAVSSLEAAWARLSRNPEYQRCVKNFFKPPAFYIGCSGLYAGTSKVTGKRAVFCDQQCLERLSTELAGHVTVLDAEVPTPDIQSEWVKDVLTIALKSENDVKALFKEIKRFDRQQKRNRQEAAERELLRNVRSWIVPFQVPEPAEPPAAGPLERPAESSPSDGCAAQSSGGDCARLDGCTRPAPILSHSTASAIRLNTAQGNDPGVTATAIAISASSPPRSCGSSPEPSDAVPSSFPAATSHVPLTTTHTSPAYGPESDTSRRDNCTLSQSDCTAFSGSGSCAGGAEGVLVVFCSIDLEWWERNPSLVTEVGWSLWDNLSRRLTSRHHIVEEHRALVNRTYVPDHKYDFLFGRSSTGSLAQGAAALQRDLDYYGEFVWTQWWGQQQQQQRQSQPQEQHPYPQREQQEHEPEEWPALMSGGGASKARSPLRSYAAATAAGLPLAAADTVVSEAAAPPPPTPTIQLVVVGHGLSQDLKALSQLLAVTIPPSAAMVDTADLSWLALEQKSGQQRNMMSLRVLLKALDIQASKLHNGGNDARYTLEALLALAAREPPSS